MVDPGDCGAARFAVRFVSVAAPVPVPDAVCEIVSPSAVMTTFAVAVATVVGLKRTVTVWVAFKPTRLNGLPETTLKGAGTDTVPETVPPTMFCTVKVLSANAPKATPPKFMRPPGLTTKLLRAAAAAAVEHALSLPLRSTAVTATKYVVPFLSPVSLNVVL